LIRHPYELFRLHSLAIVNLVVQLGHDSLC
jgi:hypothetical protein